jgi:predicted O-linked N-acetylglucosamine transferase (SPINDLY family)
LELNAQKQLFREKFAAFGIDENRIEFMGLDKTTREHLARYHQIDIALDTFPYNGVTTTCEALWMGVPVIVLAGKTHVSRTGTSLLSNADLTQFIAQNQNQYLEVAVKTAQNKNELAELRKQLRATLQCSDLMNAKKFIGNLEALYRQVWVKWCGLNVKKTTSVN